MQEHIELASPCVLSWKKNARRLKARMQEVFLWTTHWIVVRLANESGGFVDDNDSIVCIDDVLEVFCDVLQFKILSELNHR
jgi:hypothetical protein